MSSKKTFAATQTEDSLRAELEALQAQILEKDEAHKRALADYQNLVRRSAEERKILISSANESILTALLPTVDHLEMALQHFGDSSLEMINSELKRTLESFGLRRMEVVGKVFDPNAMEAVDTAAGESGVVLKEQRAGYFLNDRVLRYAEVIVGK